MPHTDTIIGYLSSPSLTLNATTRTQGPYYPQAPWPLLYPGPPGPYYPQAPWSLLYPGPPGPYYPQAPLALTIPRPPGPYYPQAPGPMALTIHEIW